MKSRQERSVTNWKEIISVDAGGEQTLKSNNMCLSGVYSRLSAPDK